MKSLLLLRHAKSSWEDLSLSDFERPLNNRGREAAPFMGSYIRKQGLLPDMIISSPAVRTKQTAIKVAKAAGLTEEIIFDDRIYEATVGQLLDVIAEIKEEPQRVLLVGHNPGMENLVRHLTGEIHRVPTACLISISLDIARWSEINEASGTIDLIARPRELMPS